MPPALKRDRIQPGDSDRCALRVADGVKDRRRASGSDIVAPLVLEVRRSLGPRTARMGRGRHKQRPAAVNAEHVVDRVHIIHMYDVAALDVTLTRCLVPAAESLSHLDASQIRRVLVNECVLQGNLTKKNGLSAMGAGTKKADVVECCKTFDHVGILVNGPPGAAGLPFI